MQMLRQLGRTGLKVSRLSLGTMMFGAQTPPEDARRIADLCLERGVFFWDTADMYAQGRSEEIVGELLASRRMDIVLATKAGRPMSPRPNDQGLSRRHLLAACEASLKRLGTDFIDIYYMHFPDRETPVEETLRAMEDLVRSGKVRHIGISNHPAWEVADRIALARAHGWQPIDVVQPLYNAVNRDIERELIPMAHHYGLGVVTFAPIARGVLSGKYRWDEAPPEGSRLSRQDRRMLQVEWRKGSLEVVEALRPVAEELGRPLSQLATAWALANERVDSVIIGPRTYEQAVDALESITFALPREFEEAVDRLVPRGTFAGQEVPDQEEFPVMGRGTVWPDKRVR